MPVLVVLLAEKSWICNLQFETRSDGRELTRLEETKMSKLLEQGSQVQLIATTLAQVQPGCSAVIGSIGSSSTWR